MMDETSLLDRLEDEENAAIVSIAEAAAMGAKNAVLEEVHRAEEAALAAIEVGTGASGPPTSHAVVAGVLPLKRAENVAAEGALKAVHVAVCLVPPAARKLMSSTDLLQVQAAAATGAAAGVRGLAFMVPLAANPLAVLDKHVVAAAAGSGAWAACYNAVRAVPTRSTANQWAARLPHVLGASLALAAGVYPRFTSSSDIVVSVLYGGLILLIFMLMVGIVSVPFRSMSPETVSRHVTFASFTTLIVLLTVVLCTLLSGKGFIVLVGVLGGLVVVSLIYLWVLSNRYYRAG